MSLGKDEWMTLVLIPAAVSIAANIVTPIFQRATTSVITRSLSTLRSGNRWIFNVRLRQIEEELFELRSLQSDHLALMQHYQRTLYFLLFCLWAVILSPVLGVTLEILVSNYGHHLPMPWQELSRIRGLTFSLAVVSIFFSGPFQAALYGSALKRKLKKLTTNPDVLFSKLEREKVALTNHLSTHSAQ